MVCNTIGVECKKDLDNAKKDEDLQYYLECMKPYQSVENQVLMAKVVFLDESYWNLHDQIRRLGMKHYRELEALGQNQSMTPLMVEMLKSKLLEQKKSRLESLEKLSICLPLMDFDDDEVECLSKMLAARGFFVKTWLDSQDSEEYSFISISRVQERDQLELEKGLFPSGFVRAVHPKYVNRRL
jgi:hypothetical protein